jgi:hypothetical protein
MLLASGLQTGDVVIAGFVVSGQSWTLISSSIGLDWIVGAESLRVALFPLFLGGILVPVKIFLDQFMPNSCRVFAGFSSWMGFMSSLGRLVRLCGCFVGCFGLKKRVYWFSEFRGSFWSFVCPMRSQVLIMNP